MARENPSANNSTFTSSQTVAGRLSSSGAPPSFWLHFTAGGLAGTIGAVATCPLEVVKTRLQSSLYTPTHTPTSNPLTNMRGVVRLLVDIARVEGVRALWKGVGPNLIGVVPARSIHFAVYTQVYFFFLISGIFLFFLFFSLLQVYFFFSYTIIGKTPLVL